MIFAFCLIGGLFGWNLLGGFDGFLVGAAMGAMFSMLISVRAQLHALTARVNTLTQGAPGVVQNTAVPHHTTTPMPAAAEVASTVNIPIPAAAIPTPQPVADPNNESIRAAGGATDGRLLQIARSTAEVSAPARERLQQKPQERPQETFDDTEGSGPATNWQDSLLGRAWAWLTEGNLPVKAGVVVFLFGVAAAIQYAASLGWLTLPMPVRLMLIAAIAGAGLAYGIRSAVVRPAFGVAVQGGALGVLLLVVFGAFARYQLISPSFAFACVVALVAAAAGLALRFNAPVLAVLGFLGGFLAPVLISTGTNNPVALFTYIALLDVAVLAIAWRRPWRALNLLAFVGTFILGTLWGSRYYSPEFFYQVEPFLVIFFIFFAAIPLLYARAAATKGEHRVDTALLFGTPLVAFPLQVALLGDDALGLGLSALAVAGAYAGIALLARVRPAMAHLTQAAAAIAVGFLALAAPLALSGRWTSAAWALQGLAMVFVGLSQKRQLTRYAGVLLIGMGTIAGLVHLVDGDYFTQPERFFFNANAMDVGILVLAPFLGAWLHQRAAYHLVARGLLALSVAWWATWGLREIGLNLQPLLEMGSKPGFMPAAAALFAALTAAICSGLVRRMIWPALATIQALACFAILILGTAALFIDGHWFVAPLWLLWPACFLALLVMPTIDKGARQILPHAHAAVLGLLVAGISISLWRVAGIQGLGDGWQIVLAAAAPALLMGLLVKRWRWALWPVEYGSADRNSFVQLTGIVLAAGWVVAQFQPGSMAPMPFVPVFNPLDLAILAGLFLAWRHQSLAGSLHEASTRVSLALGGWFVLTMGVLRSSHHLADLPWSTHILTSPVAQASLTVAWCVAGVVAWMVGSKRGSRPLWKFGAILLAVVLAKLMLIDRMLLGNMEGIIAFLVVGALLVVVGRVAPSPPK